MPRKDLFTIREIAGFLDIPDTTCLEWSHRFGEALTFIEFEDERYYSEESVAIFRFIAEQIGNGVSTEEIQTELSRTGIPVIVDEDEKPHHPDATAVLLKPAIAPGLIASIKNAVLELAPTAKRFFEKLIRDAVISAMQSVSAAQQEEIKGLHRKVAELETKIDHMSGIIRELNATTSIAFTPAPPGAKTPAGQPNRTDIGLRYQAAISNTIVKLRDEKHLSFHQIAELFKKKGLKPLNRHTWHPIGISVLYQQATRDNRKEPRAGMTKR